MCTVVNSDAAMWVRFVWQGIREEADPRRRKISLVCVAGGVTYCVYRVLVFIHDDHKKRKNRVSAW